MHVRGKDHDGLLEGFREMSDWTGNCSYCGAPARTDRELEGGSGIKFYSYLSRADVTACRMAASQYEQSAARYRAEKNGGLTAEAHEKLAAQFREMASHIEMIVESPPTLWSTFFAPEST